MGKDSYYIINAYLVSRNNNIFYFFYVGTDTLYTIDVALENTVISEEYIHSVTIEHRELIAIKSNKNIKYYFYEYDAETEAPDNEIVYIVKDNFEGHLYET